MTSFHLFWIIISAIALGFTFDLIISLLNTSHRSRPIPKALLDVYPPERYRLQQEYQAVNTRLNYIQKGIETAALIVVIGVGGFGWLHGWLTGFELGAVITTLAFFAILGLASGLLSIPFSAWDTFVVEQRFGFNRSTPKLFITDLLKSLALSAVLGGALLALITWIFYRTGSWFWIIALVVMVLFSLLANALYSRVIVPLFNKQKPLEEGDLLERIRSFGLKVGFPVSKVFVIDGSKRSTKANAYFSGFGRNRRVVLFDTLIDTMTTDQVLAVLAHEIGHYRKRHIWINIGLGVLQSAIILFLFSLIAQTTLLPQVLGYSAQEPIFHLSLLGFGILLGPIQIVMGFIFNQISRTMEYQADAFARKHGLAIPLIEGLKALSAQNLSNLTPHPAYVWAHYSHPPLQQRVERLMEA